MSRKPRILCVGAATLDTVFRLSKLPTEGGKYIPDAAYQFAAGMASSAAVAIARLGGKPALWARVGRDQTGERIIAELTAEGVDCGDVERIDGARSAFCTTLVDAGGERIVVPFYDPQLREAPLGLPKAAVADFDAVLVDVRWPEGAEAALRAASDAGVSSVLDADVSPLATLELLTPLANYAVFSAPAALALADRSDIRLALTVLARRLPGHVAITSGADGCFWVDRATDVIRHRRAPRIEAVDTLSAGDVFHGAFALSIAEGRSEADAAEFANAAAALKCTRFGGRLGAPTRDEIERFLNEMVAHAQ
jgi:sulfofructose kinase